MECQEQIAVQPHERPHTLTQTLFPLLASKLFRCSLQADIEGLFHGRAPVYTSQIAVSVAAVFAVARAAHDDAVAAAKRSSDLREGLTPYRTTFLERDMTHLTSRNHHARAGAFCGVV